METFSVKNLCKQLISFAIQRCRLSGDPCRLSVVIRRSTISDHTLTHVSVSDTGAGSCLKEFQDLQCSFNGFYGAGWDGVLSITTTSISDSELFHYKLNFKENASNRRLTKLPSMSKNNAKFSGTEVSMSTAEDLEFIVADITSFLKKLLILKIHNIAVELVVERGDPDGVPRQNVLLASELTSLLFRESSNIEQLTSGLEDYVHKHRNNVTEKCCSCFKSSDDLKVGNGQASMQKQTDNVLVVEAVIMISESLEPSSPSCLKAFEPKTEVLYFRDFSPSSFNQTDLKALSSINWNSYGLTLKSISDNGGSVSIEWESLPLNTHVDIALHCYNKQIVVPPSRQRIQLERKLMKKSVILALDDLKEKYDGVLLSAHALKIHSYAPDLARSIAGLILSSDDPSFQGECLEILGLQLGNIEENSVEKSINDKLISVIDLNDRKHPTLRCKEAAPSLFGENQIQEYMYDEYEEDDEENCTSMDF